MTANDTILGKVSKTIENVNLVEHGGLITSRAHELLTAQREIDRPVRWIGITEVWGYVLHNLCLTVFVRGRQHRF